jgi:Domain of unknown function (DUF4296)
MRAGLLILYISILVAGCKSRVGIPANILSQAKMQQVLWDMTRADLFLVDYLKKDSTLDKRLESIKLYQQVFRIHQVSKEEFRQSMEFYKTHPVYFKPILDSISILPAKTPSRLLRTDTIKNGQLPVIRPKLPGQDTTLLKKEKLK